MFCVSDSVNLFISNLQENEENTYIKKDTIVSTFLYDDFLRPISVLVQATFVQVFTICSYK